MIKIDPLHVYTVAIGVLLILGAITMVRRGEGGFRFTTIRVRRSEMPVRFWIFVALMAAVGLLGVVAGLMVPA